MDEKDIPRIVTVKELIAMLLDCPMDWQIVIRSKGGNIQHGSRISVKEPESLGCLFA